MSTTLVISDDGDEVVNFYIEEELIGSVNHDEYGWAGMTATIELVEAIAEAYGIPIRNEQDIV